MREEKRHTEPKERSSRAWLTLIFLLLLAASVPSRAWSQQDKVTLLLKWDHQFQFAGYYAAQWQGFYADAGIEVEFRTRVKPDGSLLNVVDEVAEGRADFGVGSVDILVGRDQGIPLVILTSIFQRSPYALVSLEDTPLDSPQDIVGKRIGYQAGALGGFELDALMHTAGIKDDQVIRVPFQTGLAPLLDDVFDVSVAYPSSALWEARERGIEINLLYPSDYETPFYGDTLFTHQRLTEEDPGLCQRFRDATLRGWQFAMDRPEEVALRIAAELKPTLPVEDYLEFGRFESDMVRQWMRYPEVEIGATNSWRWTSIYRQLVRTGLVKGGADLEQLVFEDYGESASQDPPAADYILAYSAAAAVAVGLVVLFMFTTIRHWTLLLVASGIVLIGTMLTDNAQRQTLIQDRRLQITNRVSALRAQLEGSIRADVQLVQSVAAYISMNPNISEEEFFRFASQLIDDHTNIRALVAAPDLVVRYAYPPEMNQAVMGLNYRTEPSQRDAALRAVETRAPVVAGPIELRQGGRGLVVRTPVFLSGSEDGAGETLWGLVGVSLDFDRLARTSGLTTLDVDLDIAIRGRDGLGVEGDVFFGDGKVLDNDPVIQEVVLASGNWQVAAIPRGGWEALDRPVLLVWTAGCILLSFMILMLIFRERQARELEENAKRLEIIEATRAKAQALARVSTLRHNFSTKTVTLSPEFCELIGLPRGERTVTQEEFMQFVDPVERERLSKLADFALTGNSRYSSELKLLRSDGKPVQVLMQSEVAQNPGGSPTANFVTVQDITERHDAEAALQASEERFKLAMLGSNDMLWDANLTTNEVYYSPRFCELFEVSTETSQPEIAIENIHPDDIGRVMNEFVQAIEGKADKVEVEMRMRTSSGREYDMLCRALIVRDEQGTAIRMVGTNVDLTPVKQAEREARRLEAQLQQAHKMEAIGHLAGGIAHDFNNILASILGYSELALNGIRNGIEGSRIEQYLGEVELAATRARDLVRQLLTFSRPGKTTRESVSVAEAVEEALSILRATLPATITVAADLTDGGLRTLSSASQLHQLLLNLVINARDAIEDTGRVDVTLRRNHAEDCVCASCHQPFDGEFAVIAVSDNGCGISTEDIGRIFEPFYTSKEPGKGSGMGLAVVHGTLYSMGGHLLVESLPGTGTTISVYLPLHESAATEAEGPVTTQASPVVTGLRLLLAEDEDAVAGFLGESLGNAGLMVTRARNGKDAADLFAKDPAAFDLLLTDHAMPIMSGTQLAHYVRELRPDLPVILISGNTDAEEIQYGKGRGISLMLEKPIRVAKLLTAIGEVMANGRAT